VRPNILETFERKRFVDTTNSGNVGIHSVRTGSFEQNFAMRYIYISTYMYICFLKIHTKEKVLEVYKNLVKYRSDNNFVELQNI